MIEQVTVVMIHFQTPDLVSDAFGTFRSFYPEIPVIIIDNGSMDGSRRVLDQLAKEYPASTRIQYLGKNIFHGPAMDYAMKNISSPYVFFMDTDVRVKRGGFLEPMMAEFDSAGVYGVGRLNTVNKRGFAAKEGTTIVLTPYMMLRRAFYLGLPPFEHHGMPTLNNFSAALRTGYRFTSFPVDDYIEHFGRGTAGRYGYQLGLKGRWSFVLNKLGL